jgi:DNA (cytosine-5)-methyltransferase 1
MIDRAIDLFAGPGGWDVACKALNIEVIGIEFDDVACQTRRLAGHKTVQADVASLDPLYFTDHARGLIASPPCQGFTQAGLRKGHGDAGVILEAIAALDNDANADLQPFRDRCEDSRSMLVVEPLRWALILRPEWIAFEQVPYVITFWEKIGEILYRHGYKGEAGVLNTRHYGMGQERKRSVLIMSRVHAVTLPKRSEEEVTMFDVLGWGITDSVSGAVIARSSGQGAPNPLDGGSGARDRYREAIRRGAWVDQDGKTEEDSVWSRMRPTLEEAAMLQSFPRDYPFHGDMSKVVEQIGNAVPPKLALALLRSARGDV